MPLDAFVHEHGGLRCDGGCGPGHRRVASTNGAAERGRGAYSQ
jgi:hypothetical protein